MIQPFLSKYITPAEQSLLTDIANSHTSVGYRAQAILYQARGYEFPVIIPPLNDGDVYGYTVFKQGTTLTKFGEFVPNPANGSTTLPYHLADTETATLHVFDINGRNIVLANLQGNGNYVFDAKNAGLYIYTITINGNVVARNKLTIVK